MRIGTVFAALVSIAVVALLTLQVASAPAAPPPMMPLEIGNQWDYVGASGGHQVETITGTQLILGRTVFVKSYTVGPDAGLENYWLTNTGGDVLLAGFNNPSGGFALAYDPPITFCGGAPSLGDVWATHVTAYNLSDMSVYGVFDITFSALEDVSLSVPAGSFPCIGVGQVAPGPTTVLAVRDLRGLTLDGRPVTATLIASTTSATDWYSP
ncbi:MAG: hypothetical protein ACRDL7_14815, partial [Gaiellaceae bacterium]